MRYDVHINNGEMEMKNLYAITSRKGIHLCYQVAESEQDAVHIAKIYYGHRAAYKARFIREDN